MSIRGFLVIFITFIVFIWSFKKPKIGVFYFLCLMFLREGYLIENIPEIYESWHLPLVTGWLVLVAWFSQNLSQGKKIQLPKEFILLIFLGIVILISKNNAVYPQRTMEVFDDYIRMVILLFLIINVVRTEQDLKHLLIVLISIIGFLVLYAYYKYKTEYLQIAVPYYTVDRNFFAESIVAIVPFAYVFFENAKKTGAKVIFFGIFALMCMGVILTYSRGGFLALGIVLLFLFIKSKKKLVMVTMVIILLALALPRIGEKYKDRIRSIQEYQEDGSAVGRIITWNVAIDMFRSSPLIGIGAGNFNYAYPDFCPTSFQAVTSDFISIHNMFLQILSETGILGGGLFILVIIMCLWSVHRLNILNKKLPKNKQIDLSIPNAAGISLIGFCGAGYFLPGAYYSYIYIVFAIVIASRLVYMEKLRSDAR